METEEDLIILKLSKAETVRLDRILDAVDEPVFPGIETDDAIFASLAEKVEKVVVPIYAEPRG